MNKHIESGFKKVKLFWDAYKMIIGVVALLGSLGIGGYVAYEPEPMSDVVDTVDELEIITPEYALKDHTHPSRIVIDHSPAIRKAIDNYNKKHDPQKLKH